MMCHCCILIGINYSYRALILSMHTIINVVSNVFHFNKHFYFSFVVCSAVSCSAEQYGAVQCRAELCRAVQSSAVQCHHCQPARAGWVSRARTVSGAGAEV